MTDPTPPALPASLADLDVAFQAWLDERAEAHAGYKHEPADFGDKVELLRALQRELFDAGWARHGWPQEHGGSGGTVLHRGVIVDVLERNGFPPRHIFEHLEILPPALARFANPKLLEDIFLPTLRGDAIWCQGFSEPTAGSDLAALRTRARRVAGGYQLEGHKIWTSWAKWATHCFVLARTGEPEERHRGLSAFVIRLDAPGVTVGAIRQSNGSDELAEVFFDQAFVPEDARVGDEGQGWAIAMYILAGERGSYTWLRQCEMLPRLELLAQTPGAGEHAGLLGESLMRLVALRCRSREVMEILAAGKEPGPESSVSKVLSIDAEQEFYQTAREVLSPGLDLGTAPQIDFWQEHYLYSRASSVYGGSRQIQLNVIAKLMITRGMAVSLHDESSDELATLRQSITESIAQTPTGRAALDGLDWWSFAGAPEDEFGRAAFAAWFEAEGAAPTTSPALSGLRAAAVAAKLGVDPAQVAFAVAESEAGLLVLGLDEASRWIVVERKGELVVFDARGLQPTTSTALDATLIQRVSAPGAATRIEVDRAADSRALDLARIAAAYEILGASRTLLSMAIQHSNEREQFGQPIAKFQAIQHLISECQIEVSTLEAVCRAALEEWSAGGGRDLARIAKAIAGRDGRAIAQRALQCFGAIGFTAEHRHHLYSRRIHTLDAVFGTYQGLRRGLGAELVRTGKAPRGIQVWHP